MRYCESLKKGYYLSSDRCIYASGKTKGNKWIMLDAINPVWTGLLWNCIEKYSINNSTYYVNNPTKYKF